MSLFSQRATAALPLVGVGHTPNTTGVSLPTHSRLFRKPDSSAEPYTQTFGNFPAGVLLPTLHHFPVSTANNRLMTRDSTHEIHQPALVSARHRQTQGMQKHTSRTARCFPFAMGDEVDRITAAVMLSSTHRMHFPHGSPHPNVALHHIAVPREVQRNALVVPVLSADIDNRTRVSRFDRHPISADEVFSAHYCTTRSLIVLDLPPHPGLDVSV